MFIVMATDKHVTVGGRALQCDAVTGCKFLQRSSLIAERSREF